MPDNSTKSLPTLASELFALVRDYAKQETLDPIKGLGRFIAFGVAGSVLLGIGLVLLIVALLRALQAETGTALTGNWSWAPYVITLFVTAILAIVTASRISARRGARS